jgi:tetratricopeptide (TPR) repeat protein
MSDVKNEAHCLRITGHVLAIQSVASGREHVTEALGKFESIGDLPGRAECEVVLGEIDYLRGQHDAARAWLKQAARNFAKIPDPLGHGRSLVLLGLTDLGGGNRGHLAHRGDELENALALAERGRTMMRDLKNPRGEAACQRLLSMIAFDTQDLMRSREHALAASAIYDQMGEPRGQVEASLLLAQVALATGNPAASELIRACEAIGLLEAETRQHLALSQSWLFYTQGQYEAATNALIIARAVFGDLARTGDHARQLLGRLAEFAWPKEGRHLLDDWLAGLGERRSEHGPEAKAEGQHQA